MAARPNLSTSSGQDHLTGALVVAGAASAGQLRAKIDEVPPHRRNRLRVGRAGSRTEGDRDLAAGEMKGSVGNLLGASQQYDDAIGR